MQNIKNKTMAIVITMILASSMAISIGILPIANGDVINGVNYDDATAAAIKAGMKWDIPYNASTSRLLLWDRWDDHVPTYVYISVTPNPVGAGQEMTYLFFNPQVPNPSSDKYLFTIDITQPSGTVVTLPAASSTKSYTMAIQDGKFVSDTTGSCWTTWVPTEVGNHSITVKFWGTAVSHTDQSFIDSSTNRGWYGVTLDPSTYTTTFIVQQEAVHPTGWTDVPLPTEYWARPIEGQNTAWYQVASNWYNNAHDSDNGGADNKFQADGIAPNSGHILWTKPTEDGGVVGGDSFKTPGDTFNAGHQYQTRWDGNQIIMDGRLYYRESNYYSASPGDFVAVDLLTGEEIWRNRTMSATPSFGYQYEWDDMNQHGVVEPGWLFSSNFGTSIHPILGLTGLSLRNVPSGTAFYGPKGEELRYTLTNVGNTTNPLYALSQWNSSRVFISQVSGNLTANVPISPARPTTTASSTTPITASTYNATSAKWTTASVTSSSGYSWYWYTTSATTGNWIYTQTASMTAANLATNTAPSYDWNITLSNIPFTAASGQTPSIRAAIYNDVLLVSNGSLPTAPSYTYAEYATFWGINLNSSKGAIGQLLWGPTNIDLVTDKNQNLDYQRAAEGVFVFQVDPDMSWIAYSMYTGQKLWDSMAIPESADNTFAYYISSTGYNPSGNAIAYGKLFSTGYVGFVYAYDLKTGELLWKQSAPTGMEKFEYYTLMIGAIADGKIYIGTHEHSADTPLFKGAKLRCYNVTDGTQLFALDGWANPHTVLVADGVLAYWNNYDAQVYALGKGPSSMAVSIENDVVQSGSSVMIKGTVTDISAGTKQKEQAARFPQGVPAVSDASMSDWMAYVYMQKPRPTNTVGVPITLSVVDANGNYREIGTTTGDADGFFSYNWMPDIEGKYTVYASFPGSESYWPSHAVTAFAVDPAAPTPPPQPETIIPNNEMTVIGAAIAIIAAIAIATLLILKKK